MNDPQLNQCINATSALLKKDPAVEVAVLAIVQEAYRHGRLNALKEVADKIYLLQISGSAS